MEGNRGHELSKQFSLVVTYTPLIVVVKRHYLRRDITTYGYQDMVSSLSPSTRGLGARVSALHRLRVGLVAGAPVLAHAELLHAAGHHALAFAAGHLLGGVARVLARLALRQVVCVFRVCSSKRC